MAWQSERLLCEVKETNCNDRKAPPDQDQQFNPAKLLHCGYSLYMQQRHEIFVCKQHPAKPVLVTADSQ